MKKKEKKIMIVTLVIAVLIIIGVTIIFIIMQGNNKEKTDLSENQQGMDQSVADYEYSIQNAAEKDGIKATKIDFHVIGNQIEVVTSLKNDSGEKLNGYYIEINLLDKKNNIITTIADNSTDVIEAGASKDLYNYVVDAKDSDKIAKAEIVTLEKSSISDSINEKFDNMMPDEMLNEQTQNVELPQLENPSE